MEKRLEKTKNICFTGYKEFQYCRSEKLSVIKQREESHRQQIIEKMKQNHNLVD